MQRQVAQPRDAGRQVQPLDGRSVDRLAAYRQAQAYYTVDAGLTDQAIDAAIGGQDWSAVTDRLAAGQESLHRLADGTHQVGLVAVNFNGQDIVSV